MKNSVQTLVCFIALTAMLPKDACSRFTILNGALVIATGAPSLVLQHIDFANKMERFG